MGGDMQSGRLFGMSNVPGRYTILCGCWGHNSHPLHMNIQRRGVELDTRCAVCGGYFEDGGHFFFRCKYAKALWRAADLENERRALMQHPTSLEVLEGIFALEEGKKLKGTE